MTPAVRRLRYQVAGVEWGQPQNVVPPHLASGGQVR